MSLAVHFSLQRNNFRLDVNLDLPTHGVTAIFGPSGSGKTTLLRVIAGLEQIPGARVVFNQHTWQDGPQFMPVHQRPIGYVFQQLGLFPHLDVQANLDYGLSRVAPEKRRIALDDAIDLLDIGDLLHRSVTTLSGGEQQRVAIARTLGVSPGILLMDEPLSSLDQKLKLEILPYLENLHRNLNIPILYVSHATDEVARLADNLVILRKGEILGSGAIQDMLTRLDLPLSHRSDAESLLEGKVSRIDHEYSLTELHVGGNIFTVTGTALKPDSTVRLRIAAHDVSLALEKQAGTSIQNIFPVTVEEMTDENESQMLIKLSLGKYPLLARVTRKAVNDLAITRGRPLFAQIKSVAVLA